MKRILLDLAIAVLAVGLGASAGLAFVSALVWVTS